MEWIVGIYLVIGVLKTLSTFANTNPALKPLWMSTGSHPFKMAIMFMLHALFWPFTG